MTDDPALPRPQTAHELKDVLELERGGEPFLLYRDAGGTQQLFALPAERDSITLGRAAAADLALSWDAQVSGVHAELHLLGGEWTIVDDGLSRNGTYLNGTRVSGRQRLRDGDQLRLGKTMLAFHSAAAQEVSPTVLEGGWERAASLSDTQRRVLIALCRPYKDGSGFVTPATNLEIAGEIFLSVDAVKTHLRTLFHKFDLDDLPQNQKRVRLAERALQLGLVTPRDL
jgi:DNA-binding CsgD family transcriptional regulator